MLSISSSVSDSKHDPQYCIQLDGSSNGIETNYPIHGTQVNFSTSAWIAFTNPGGQIGPFYLGANCYFGTMGISGDICLFAYNSGALSMLTLPSDWDDGNWHFISLYWDKDNITNTHIYWDGAEISQSVITNNGAGRGNIEADNFLQLGSKGMVGKFGFSGVHSGEITLAQHTELYNRGRNYDWRFNSGNYNIASNLQGFWMMGQGIGDVLWSGITQGDDAGNSISGTGFGSGLEVGIIQDQTDISAPNLNYTNLVHNSTFATSTTAGNTGSGFVFDINSSEAGGDPVSAVAYSGGGLEYDRNSTSDLVGVLFKDGSGNNIMPGANLMYRIKYDVISAGGGTVYVVPMRPAGHSQAEQGGGFRLMQANATGTDLSAYWINRGTETGLWLNYSGGSANVTVDNVEIAIVNNGKCARLWGGVTVKSS